MRGSVIQKQAGSGRWYVVLDLGRDGTGRRQQKWHSGYRSKRDAERGLTALLSARDTGTYVEPQRVTLGEYLLERWLPAVESTVRPATYDGYGRHLRRYVVPALGALPLQSVQPDALSVFYRDLLDHGGAVSQPLAAATVRRIHATLHRALRDAVAWGYLLRNPASVAVKPKQRGVGSLEMRTWSAAELRAFLDHVQGDRLYAAWRLAASTGVRRGELLGLRWVDVDLAAGHVAVRQTLTAVRGKLLFDAPKTARSQTQRRAGRRDRDCAPLVACGPAGGAAGVGGGVAGDRDAVHPGGRVADPSRCLLRLVEQAPTPVGVAQDSVP